MVEVNDPILSGLLRELQEDDATVVRVDHEFKEARARLEVASKKYAVLRDIVTRRLGRSPYSETIWTEDGEIEFASAGRFRFAHMDIGDAALAALEEADEPMTLDELVTTLQRGGIGHSAVMLTRMVNAAIMKKSGIGRTEDGRYHRDREQELEDLPF